MRRDDEAAAGPEFDAIQIEGLFRARRFHFTVDAAHETNEDGGVRRRGRALCRGGVVARHEARDHPEHPLHLSAAEF